VPEVRRQAGKGRERAAKFLAAALPGLVLHPKVVVRENASIAWAVRKGSPQLLAALNPSC
jgi:hypothetical protein